MNENRGWLIHQYDAVSSTMETAAHLARFGAPDRTAVISTRQSAGRGRAGRTWDAPPGTALFCTLILRPRLPPDRLATLPLVTGVAVAEALEAITGCPVLLKWPNDVWIGADAERRKVAGILVTTSLHGGTVDNALVGIGVNVLTDLADLPPGATSVLAATGVASTPADVLAACLRQFDRVYEAFLGAAGSPSLDGWRERAALLGEDVIVEDARRIHAGVFAGIDSDGALLLREGCSSVRRVVAGDLVRGPRQRGI